MKILTHSPLQAALVEAGLLDHIKRLPDIGAAAKKGLVTELKSQIHHVSDNLKISKDAVVKAFNEPKLSNMLEACGYSFATMYGAFHMGHKIAEEGALHVIAHFAEHTALHKLAHKSSHKAKAIDDFINKYPVMKKVTGPALAGLILYGYTLTEPHKLADWDLSKVKHALTGDFGVTDFMNTPEALYLGTHVATGKALSLTALAENVTTLSIGLTCTAILQSSNPKMQALGKTIGDAAKKFLSKKTPLVDIQNSKSFTGTEALKSKVTFDPAEGKPPADNQTKAKDKAKDKDKDKDKDKKENKNTTEPDWWKQLSDGAQTKYLKNHPDSNYKKTQKQKAA
jgi:hypothetical protein